MTFEEAAKILIWNLRLDFDPVGIRYVLEESELKHLPVTHASKAKLTFCQFLAAARQARMALFMKPEKCLCENAQPVFGFRDLEEKTDTDQHLKYFLDRDLAREAPRQKARLSLGQCKGVYVGPLEGFDRAELPPSVVFIMGVPYQAYHLLNDYMGATGKPNLSFFHTPNSAVCSGSVHAYTHGTVNMTTMCSGSKTSGKTEMNYLNLFIPGSQFLSTVAQQVKRVEETGGPSLLGKGGQPWPGLDACKACPMFKFEPV